MNDLLLETRDLIKYFGGVIATDCANLQVEKNELHALIGPNGAGKTTLISQISGIISPDSGEIMFNGQRITSLSAPDRALMGLARSFQVTSVLKDFTCQENVALAVQAHHGHSFRFWKPVSQDHKIQKQAIAVLESIGMIEYSSTFVGELAHGQQRQLEIAIALAMNPKLLLLDEPLAGMGMSDSGKIVDFLRKLKKDYTILLVEHDMDAVFALADRISVMVYGRLIASGAPDKIQQDELVQSAYLGG